MTETWTDPNSGYVSESHAGGLLQQVIDICYDEADLGDGDWFLDKLLKLSKEDRMVIAAAIYPEGLSKV